MTGIQNIDRLVGKAIEYDGEKLLVSHFSQDGLMTTMHTDKGLRSFLTSSIDEQLKSIKMLGRNLKGSGQQEPDDQPVGHRGMKSTTQYDMFGRISSNRKIDRKHVKNLVEVIRANNLLHLNPIIVDGELRVVDGQHRLEAARQLGVPIYYIVNDSVGKTDIAALNSNKKNWSLVDYINFHTKENRPGFKRLQEFMELYPMMPVSSALTLLSGNGRHDTAAIRQGHVDVSNADQAEEIAEFLLWLRPYYDAAFSNSVAHAIRQMFDAEGFEVDFFKKKIEQQPRSLVKCINRKQYQEMFLEIYNYKLSINRLSL